VNVRYAVGCSLHDTELEELSAALEACRGADVIVLALGDDLKFIGETKSTATLELPGGQRALLEAVIELGLPVVIALVNSKPLVLPAAAERAAAIVECFNPGMEGGRAFAELLFGDLNPSGRLTISFPRHVGQQPTFYSQVRGQHGDAYADLDQVPRFCFGFGLSYTRFEYSGLRITSPSLAEGQALTFELVLKNAGSRAGIEVAQVYLSDLVTSVTWANQSLVAFQRVSLEAGEQRTLQFSVPYERLSLVDAYERRRVEPGEFEIAVGASANDASRLRGRFAVEGEAFSLAGIPGAALRAP